MLAIAEVLGKLLENYFQSHKDAGRDCRLLVPGLTTTISRQIHEFLIASGINSILVIGENEEPSQESKRIRAVALTSIRIGSFVAIASPGQLIHIQDSIRGSGGAIRSMAFSEEWPWLDNGNESFRFDGPVLDALVSRWSANEDEQAWIREFVNSGLIQYTRPSSIRAQLLLDNILGTFDLSLYPEIEGVREKLLFHSGIAQPHGDIPAANKLIRSTVGLSQKVIERCQKEESVREQARDMVLEVVPINEQQAVGIALDHLLDGIGKSQTTDLGLLAFNSCWGPDKNDPTHWRVLRADLIAEIFNVRERENATIEYIVSCARSRISSNGKKIASFIGQEVSLDISYEIPPVDFGGHAWEVQVLNRQRVLVSQQLASAEGQFSLSFNTTDFTSNHSRKVPIRIVLMQDSDLKAGERLDLHLCGEDRPAFVVVEPGFEVIDATPDNTEEVPDKKINVEEPVHLYMFSHSDSGVHLYDENEDVELGIISSGIDGIWRSAQPVDVSNVPTGRVIRVCNFENSKSVICFEARDIETGEFTLEDELRVAIPGQGEKRLKDLADLFAGKSRKPYPKLGQVNDTARRRTLLANIMTSPIGWKPLLANLVDFGSEHIGYAGNFVSYFGSVNAEVFSNLKLPEEAVRLIEFYSDTRDKVRREIESSIEHDGINREHPIYASHPVFVANRSQQIERLLLDYLEAYLRILDYKENNQKRIDWLQLFILTHLDCVVHWDGTSLSSSVLLVGPWHPLVLSKRFMVQSALYARVEKILGERDKKSFRHLVTLLSRVQGFRWLTGISADDSQLEPLYVSTTSDPGWHVAFKTNSSSLSVESGFGGLSAVLAKIRYNFGVATESIAGASENLAVGCISNYLRAFPSRRSVGVRIKSGYAETNLVMAVDSYLHGDDGPTERGMELPGGVRLYFETRIDGSLDARWSDPPLHIYSFTNDIECIQKEHPDIYMLSPTDELTFKSESLKYKLPRGLGSQAVFSQPLNWVTAGQTQIPRSITWDNDTDPDSNEGIGGLFVQAAAKIAGIFGESLVAVHSVNLPQRLDAPWVVIPGKGVDPAILVKYVRDGEDRALQDRALWDYRLDIAKQDSSFFILSTIPKGFQIAVNGFFGTNDVAGGFIVELGRIGISIGGEALKSGRHALGVVGLVGAIRLFQGVGGSVPSPLARSKRAIGFIIPVDSFSSFFGKIGSKDIDLGGKRADLLAIQIVLPIDNSKKIRISCCGVESKFTSGTFGNTRANSALSQAMATSSELKELIETSLREGAMPERLALLELIRFGLRITSPSHPGELEEWVCLEGLIYRAVLRGEYEYCNPKYSAVLVTTEQQLPGVAEAVSIKDKEGLWIRLTKGHWPGISETQQLISIRTELSQLFNTCIEKNTVSMDLPRNEPVVKGEPSIDIEKNEEIGSVEPVVESLDGEINGDEESDPVVSEGPLDQIFLGVDDGRRPVYFNPQSPVDPLDNTNLLVTGSSGTGKTQLLKYLISKIREQGKPVLILDFKNDFASDLVFAEQARLDKVYIPFDGLPYNPLIPFPVRHPETGELFVQCGQHIAGVASVLKRTYGLGAQQQASVKNAMAAAFSSAGIPVSGSTPYGDNMNFPDFSNVGDTLQHDNLSAYNRLDPLFTLGLFKEEYRLASFANLIGRSAILDLSQISSEEIKNTLAQLIVLSAHAYYNSQQHSGTIRQVIVFDEAHRVLNSEYMLRLVRECRAYGVATLLSSQYPSDFPGEISASMATKIMHGNGRDLEKVKSIVQMIGCEGREGDVANLARFQAFIDNRHHPRTFLRTMNYPIYLVLKKLQETGSATREELAEAEGVDTSKLPIVNLIQELERLGLAEEKEGRVYLLGHSK